MAYTDYLGRRHRRAYEEFLNESAHAFLTMHETWLKRHEVKGVNPRRKRLTRAGVGVFAIRGGYPQSGTRFPSQLPCPQRIDVT